VRDDDAYRTNDRRVIPLLLLGLLLLFGGLYVAGYVATHDRVPKGTTVAGVSLGGMTRAAARGTLDQALQDRAGRPIVLSANGRRRSIDPAAAGLSVDVAASVAQTGVSGTPTPQQMWNYVIGGADYPAVVIVDHARLDAAVAAFARKADDPVREGAVSFRGGGALARNPRPGTALDRAAAAAAIRRAYLTASAPVRLRTRIVSPQITSAAVSRAMSSFANPAVSAPVVLEVGRHPLLLRPAVFAPALSMVPEHGRLVPHLDAGRLMQVLGPRFDPDADRITSHFLGLVSGHDQDRRLQLPPLQNPRHRGQ